jgi:protein-L-isoaspartate(D-aspartate) O-methyltransferase
VVTASPRVVPEALLAQLAPGGRLVIPLGDLETQTLTVFERQESDIIRTKVEQVRFVPLLGGRS